MRILTPEEIAELKLLCDAASAGPWHWDLDRFSPDDGVEACVFNDDINMLATLKCETNDWAIAKQSQALTDAKFIAATRTIMPTLLDDLSYMRFENERLTLKLAPLQESDPFCPRHGRSSRPIEVPGLACDCRKGTP